MGRAGAPGPSTAQAPKGKGFPCSAGPWRVHCPMHPARSAVAPGALEIGHGPCPSSLGQWSHSSRSDRRAHCPQMAAQGLSQPIPASVGASSHSVGELQGSGQSQDFLSAQKANHHPRLRLSNSLPGTNRSEVSRAAAGPGRRGSGAGQTGSAPGDPDMTWRLLPRVSISDLTLRPAGQAGPVTRLGEGDESYTREAWGMAPPASSTHPQSRRSSPLVCPRSLPPGRRKTDGRQTDVQRRQRRRSPSSFHLTQCLTSPLRGRLGTASGWPVTATSTAPKPARTAI